jgi:hypothetical protein
MRLIKQSFLYYREGNSDKVYEIDLCDTGNDKYVVNFRYGRRGSALKEGSKTPVPVSLDEAEKIFDTVETEKLTKGYTASSSGVSENIPVPSFKLPETNSANDTQWMSWPAGRNKSILLRLHNAANNQPSSVKTNWKTSRVIWKAGEYKIAEAAPYLIKLFNAGDNIQRYSCTWSLARCAANATEALQFIYTNHPSPLLKKIAGPGLFSSLNELEKEKHSKHYLNSLPEAIKDAIQNNDAPEVDRLLEERINQEQPGYNWVEDFYLLSVSKPWLKPYLKKTLQSIPLKPNYFKHVRSIYKLAELLDDFEISGMLSYRFEREAEMFSHHLSAPAKAENRETFVQAAGEFMNISKELQKKTSRLAYSQKTRWYLHRRTRRKLMMLGYTSDKAYLYLATNILICYKKKNDFSEAYSTFHYKWTRGSYSRIETRFIQNANAVYLHLILSGEHPDLKFAAGRNAWKVKQTGDADNTKRENTTKSSSGGFLKKLARLFGKKKEHPVTSLTPAAPVEQKNENGTPFLNLWTQYPSYYVQLMTDGQMNEIHQFAYEGITKHAEFNRIISELDKSTLKKLLLSEYDLPSKFGFESCKEKYANQFPDDDLAMAMLNSSNEEARSLGKQWVDRYYKEYLRESGFIADLLFARNDDIRTWGKSLLRDKIADISEDIKKPVVAKSIANMMSAKDAEGDTEKIIRIASDNLFELFGNNLKEVSLDVIKDLLLHPLPAVLLFGLRLLKAKTIDLNGLSDDFINSLLNHHYAPVRSAGLDFLNNMPVESLLNRKQILSNACFSIYEEVRTGIRPLIKKAAEQDNPWGVSLTEILMPYLLRKEQQEGLHKSFSELLSNELSPYLQNANKETALKLLYSEFPAAQNLGTVILEKYTDAAQLSLQQVISLGNHENKNVREWSWRFYQTQTGRIKYESDTSVKLLDSKWEDSRQFAMQYFRENFTEKDWNSDSLIALADSVKPDIEAFGRELITKFFTAESGTEYLLKLSQHPSEKMQLFATNYLERFAAGDFEKIQSLEFYFRSVLTRVNKGRIAKDRIYNFLLEEGRKSEVAAKTVGKILSDVSATSAIGDKARCIDILLQLNALYEVSSPLRVLETEQRG